MIRTNTLGEDLPLLGLGAMRLPLLPGTKTVDENKVAEMIDYALKSGVNYFDTAYPYHGGTSEIVIGKALSAYPRERWFLADKYPGHQIADRYDPAAIFEEQLKKCGVTYFDFYLLHNVCENSMGVYTDPKWGIIDYFVKEKERGRIRHLGFSSHARPETLRAFLDTYGDRMDFCQIQLNYLDYTLQDAKTKYDLLTARGIPVFVMEPVRGGKLANLPAPIDAALCAARPKESAAAWAFRFLQRMPNVRMILSGMSDMRQLRENVATFSAGEPLSDAEVGLLLDLAERMKDTLPCTACRYCTAGCPMGLDIPLLIAAYNDARYAGSFTVGMQIEALPEGKTPDACIGCGACTRICPQKIDIPAAMRDFTARLADMPKWSDICRERAEAAKKLQK